MTLKFTFTGVEELEEQEQTAERLLAAWAAAEERFSNDKFVPLNESLNRDVVNGVLGDA